MVEKMVHPGMVEGSADLTSCEPCRSCFKTAETEPVLLRVDLIGWLPAPTLRRCVNDCCHAIRFGSFPERLAHVRGVYGYKYFGDYEMSPEQMDAVGEMFGMACHANKLRDVVSAMIDEVAEYMTINKLGDPEKQHNVRWAREVLADYPQALDQQTVEHRSREEHPTTSGRREG